VNGDGQEDLLCGGNVLLGRTNKFPLANASATQVFDGTNGWAINVAVASTSAIGDFNGDGLADWMCGTTVVFGSRASLHGLTDVNGTNGIKFSYTPSWTVPPQNFGASIAGVGDINADGYTDVLIADSFTNWKWDNNPQSAFTIYGRPLWAGRTIHMDSTWFDAVRGFIVQDPPTFPFYPWGGPHSCIGNPAGGKGDFNGDGYDDLLIGAWQVNELYVFFGGESPAWPPALLAPVRVVDSTTGMWQYVVENPYGPGSNVVVVGMKATNAAVYVRVNGTWQPGPVAPFGTRWFTNDLRWHMNQPLTIEYASSNALGWSVNRTVLIVSTVPEPMQTGAWLALLVAVDSRRRRANPNRQDAKDAKGMGSIRSSARWCR